MPRRTFKRAALQNRIHGKVPAGSTAAVRPGRTAEQKKQNLERALKELKRGGPRRGSRH